MSIPVYLASYVFLGVILTLVVTAVREEDIGNVTRKALISFAKLAAFSVFAIVLVELLYDWVFLTYPVLVILFGWLFLGDRLSQRWMKRSTPSQGQGASRSRGSS